MNMHCMDKEPQIIELMHWPGAFGEIITPNEALHGQRMNKQENPQIEDMCIWGKKYPKSSIACESKLQIGGSTTFVHANLPSTTLIQE